jgi:hypothetical protein
MIRRLIILLLIVGCGTEPKDCAGVAGGIAGLGSTTFTTDGINDECKKECKTSIVSTDAWCDCMYKCIRNIINKNSLESEDVHLIIPVVECSIDDFKNKLNNN